MKKKKRGKILRIVELEFANYAYTCHVYSPIEGDCFANKSEAIFD